MNRETSNIQCKFFIQSSHSSLILHSLFSNSVFTHRRFSPGLIIIREQSMGTKDLYHWNDSSSKFFPLGCPSAATLLLTARWHGDTSGFLLCCYLENPLPLTVAPFLFLTTTFAFSAGPSFTKSATSELHLWERQVGTEAKNES